MSRPLTSAVFAFLQTGRVSSPAELRYRERLILPVGLDKDAGNVEVGAPLQKAVGKPSLLTKLKQRFQAEKFLLNFGEKTHMVLHQKATGEDAVRGWLVAAHVSRLAKATEDLSSSAIYGSVLEEAYEKAETQLPGLLSGLRSHGWHTQLFLEGSGVRATW